MYKIDTRTGKINVTEPGAAARPCADRTIGDIGSMAEVRVMKVPPQAGCEVRHMQMLKGPGFHESGKFFVEATNGVPICKCLGKVGLCLSKSAGHSHQVIFV